jgi:hypothetical protein
MITALKSVRPKTYVFYNEASEAFKNEIKKNFCNWYLQIIKDKIWLREQPKPSRITSNQ